ncbi:MAG: glycosyltransferase [Ruminococcus sp.]|nr:glycosyltransferase [Ruminococcus sp.]MDD5889723.1 glycosyltransferase [Ruminococcus sp.]
MENENIMVSILCTAYNHEKYIRQCLDGFVMQKTNFKFEVIVHDDASTDNTANIIREYEEKYPEIIKSICQKENQYSKRVSITKNFTLPKASGKYIAICEGDDFWTDKYKLQKQVDTLENNPNCKCCVCTVRDANEDGSMMNTTHPSEVFDSGILHTEDFLKLACKEYAFQTSSYLFLRSAYIEYIEHTPKYKKVSPVGDWPILLYFSEIGDIYYIKDEMSCYRRNAIGSYTTSMISSTISKRKKYNKGLINMIESFDECTNQKYHSYCVDFARRFRKYYYDCLKEEKNFKDVLSKENKEFFAQESFKDRMYIMTSVYCPIVAKLYDKIKK